MLKNLKVKMDADIKKVRRKYRILKVKYFLLFVLPILLVYLAYETAKQYLKVRLLRVKYEADDDTGTK